MNALGLKLAPRAEAGASLDGLRALAGNGQTVPAVNSQTATGPSVSTASASSAKGGEKTSGCPFSAMVAEMGLTSGGKPDKAGTATTEFAWSADAKEKLDRLPSFVKPMVQSSVEAFARKQGYQRITLQVMDDSKSESSNGMTWTPEAEKRLENIPDFIRPMARKEVERVAKERGMTAITAQLMDDVKEKFLKFM